MNAKKLRDSILQYAMQGKLTEQDFGDMSSLNMVQEIEVSRKQAIKDKILRHELIEPILAKPELLPDNWAYVRLPYLCKSINGSIRRGPFGSAITKSMFVPKSDTTYKVYEQGNAIQKSYEYGSYNITEEDFISLKNFEVYPKDIIISCAGTIGEMYIIPEDSPKGIINQALMKLTINEEFILNDYFLLAFQSIVSVLQKNAKGSAIKNIASLKFLKNEIAFAVPPIKEQKRILQKLNGIYKKVDYYESAYKKVAKLETKFPSNLEKSILQYAMQGKLVEQDLNDEPAQHLIEKIKAEKDRLVKEKVIKKEKLLSSITEDEIPFEIPESWEWVRLGSVVSLISGRDLTSSEYGIDNKDIPYITGASNFNNGIVEITRWTSCPKVISKKGDILITCKGTVGELAIQNIEEAHIARQVMAIRLIHSLDEKFIKLCLQHKVTELRQAAKSMIPGISRDDLLNLRISLPPLNEQRRIVQAIEKITIETKKLNR